MFKKIRKRVDRIMDNIEKTIETIKEVVKDEVKMRRVGTIMVGIGATMIVASYVR